MKFKMFFINCFTLLSLSTSVLLTTYSPLYAIDQPEILERQYDLQVQTVALLYVKSDKEFQYFLNDKLFNYIAQNSNNPDHTFTSLDVVPLDVPMVIFIENQEVLDSLSLSDQDSLKAYYDNSYFIGVGGQGEKLKAMFNVQTGADLSSIGEGFNSDFFFIHKGADTTVNELLMNGVSSTQEVLRHLMLWYKDLNTTQIKSRDTSVTSGAWDASYTADYRTQLSGGTTRFLVNGFKLKSPADKPDYYLLTTSIQTDITSHSCDSLKGHCGWFSNEMYLSAKVDTSNGGLLYDYMPTGSVGSTTKGFTIGGSLTTTQVGLSGGYSSSYSISDATYIDNSDFITNTAKWTIKFTKPNYIWFPFIVDAPNVARNSYETHPALIIEVPKGQCAKVSLYPYVLQENDTFKYEVLVLKVTENTSDWYSKDTPLPKTVICGN